MELIGREGGMGRYRLSTEEQSALQAINGVFEEEIQRLSRQKISRGTFDSINDQKAKRRFEELFPNLFPFLSTSTPGSWCRLHPEMISSRYTSGIHGRNMIETKMKFAPSEWYSSKDAELIIANPSEGGFVFMTLHLEGYTPTVIDDVVNILGKSHNPNIGGARTLKKSDEYGIAEVAELPEIARLYGMAFQLVFKADPRQCLINVGRYGDLPKLRQDAQSHENVGVRELSRKTYHEKLAELLLNFSTESL